MHMGQRQDFRRGPAIALVRCQGYGQAEVERAVGELVGHLGGLAALVAGKAVLLKPNFLVPRAAERAVMTSTVCPLASRVLSGTSLRSTRAATAWLPTSVCTA